MSAEPKVFPVMYRARQLEPGPMTIPWSLAEKAYSAYSARYGTRQSLEHLAARGGFGAGELDELIPGWRVECDEITSLRSQLRAAQAERDALGLTLEAALEREIYAGREGVALRAERDEAIGIAKRFGCGCLEPNDFCPACAELADFAARIASREKT